MTYFYQHLLQQMLDQLLKHLIIFLNLSFRCNEYFCFEKKLIGNSFFISLAERRGQSAATYKLKLEKFLSFFFLQFF